jgi:hypothetical protein
MTIPVSDDSRTYVVGHSHFERFPSNAIGCKSLGLACGKDPLNKSEDSANVCNSSPFELVGLPLETISAASLVKGSQRRLYMVVACLLRFVLTRQAGQLRRRWLTLSFKPTGPHSSSASFQL